MMKDINNQLESYSGRDKILRLIGYTSQLMSGITRNKTLSNLNDALNECRTTLRLLDDIPMLTYTLEYGLGRKEPDTYMQVCGVVVNVLDQLYYPLEHVAWAADKGLISTRSTHWWTASNVCWAFSLYFSIAKSLRYLRLLHDHSKHLDLSDPSMRLREYKGYSESRLRFHLLPQGAERSQPFWCLGVPPFSRHLAMLARELLRCLFRFISASTRLETLLKVVFKLLFQMKEYKKNQRLQLMELMSGIRSACDLAMAIHWMPEGFLWAGTLREWHLGALGTVSSILSLVQSCKFAEEL